MNSTFQEARSRPPQPSFSPAGGAKIPRVVKEVLCAPGQQLDSATRAFMEPRFGHNFGRVRVQAKLTIGASGDSLEQEAERVAGQVLARAPYPVAKANSQVIQRYSGQSTGQGDTAPASAKLILGSAGRPLESGLRQDMERRFGYDFSRVRVHTGVAAEQSARDVSANAYALGCNIVFGAGRFAPETHEGRHLLAHELTHVVQQAGADSLRGSRLVTRDPRQFIKQDGNDRTSGTHGRGYDKQTAQQTAGDRELSEGSVDVVNRAGVRLMRHPDGALPLPALTPQELLDFMISQRGFGVSKPGTPDIDPKGVGKSTGKGYQTYAAIQIVDAAGNQVTVSIGAYIGGGGSHAEQEGIDALRQGLGQDVRGGRMMVVVDQLPCSGCDSHIRDFANEIGAAYEVYVPERPAATGGRRTVSPKTAATSALQAGRTPRAKLVTSGKDPFSDVAASSPPAKTASGEITTAEVPPTRTGGLQLTTEPVATANVQDDFVRRMAESENLRIKKSGRYATLRGSTFAVVTIGSAILLIDSIRANGVIDTAIYLAVDTGLTSLIAKVGKVGGGVASIATMALTMRSDNAQMNESMAKSEAMDALLYKAFPTSFAWERDCFWLFGWHCSPYRPGPEKFDEYQKTVEVVQSLIDEPFELEARPDTQTEPREGGRIPPENP